jgi:hypothetical protein
LRLCGCLRGTRTELRRTSPGRRGKDIAPEHHLARRRGGSHRMRWHSAEAPPEGHVRLSTSSPSRKLDVVQTNALPLLAPSLPLPYPPVLDRRKPILAHPPVVSEWYQEALDYASWVPLLTTSATRIREAETLVYIRQRGDHDQDVENDHQVADEDDREHGCAMGRVRCRWHGYTALDPAWYCSSVTFSIQSTALPSSAS